MVSFLSWRAVPEQGAILPRGACRPTDGFHLRWCIQVNIKSHTYMGFLQQEDYNIRILWSRTTYGLGQSGSNSNLYNYIMSTAGF